MKIIILCIVAVLFLIQISSAEAPEIFLIEKDVEILKQEQDLLFNKIAFCESHNDPLAKNSYSSAKGRFQFLDSTWRYYAPLLWGDSWGEKSVYSYKDNTDLAWFVYTTYGTGDWEGDPKSYNCWKT